jgi:hypothetical protein
LTDDGAPCVAHRVCEIPVNPVSCVLSALRSEIRDARRADEPLEHPGPVGIAADDREARRIVAAVFETADAVDQHWNNIARRHRADDPAHVL